MKLLRFAFTIHLIFLFISSHFSQGNNNGHIEPIQICPTNTFLCVNQATANPVISVSSDLPNLEYMIIDQSVMATNASGPAIVGIDNDGIFMPSTFGVMSGGTIDVIPIAYNLADIQETMDNLLKGNGLFNLPCCLFAGTVCSDLNVAGIFCGSDVTSLEDMFPLINANGDLLSISDFQMAVADANMQLQNPATPAGCGGGDFIAYAYGNSCTYMVYDDIEILNQPEHLMSEVIQRSDYIESAALVSSPLNVEYFGGNHVELVTPFEVQLGGAFLADILVCP